MKKIFLLATGFFVLAIIMSSCKKDVVQNDNQVGISKITYYAVLNMAGSLYMADSVGIPFIDPGVTATANGISLPVTVSGTVDQTTPGVYVLTYSATNKDGYSAASLQRWVAVYSTDASADTNNFSGNYTRTSNNSVAIWSKFAPGVYKVINPGGASSDSLFTAIVFNPTGDSISMPSQISSNGSTVYALGAVYDTAAPSGYVWTIENSGYGTSARTFVKQ
jgi:hypothetical protein